MLYLKFYIYKSNSKKLKIYKIITYKINIRKFIKLNCFFIENNLRNQIIFYENFFKKQIYL